MIQSACHTGLGLNLKNEGERERGCIKKRSLSKVLFNKRRWDKEVAWRQKKKKKKSARAFVLHIIYEISVFTKYNSFSRSDKQFSLLSPPFI